MLCRSVSPLHMEYILCFDIFPGNMEERNLLQIPSICHSTAEKIVLCNTKVLEVMEDGFKNTNDMHSWIPPRHGNAYFYSQQKLHNPFFCFYT